MRLATEESLRRETIRSKIILDTEWTASMTTTVALEKDARYLLLNNQGGGVYVTLPDGREIGVSGMTFVSTSAGHVFLGGNSCPLSGGKVTPLGIRIVSTPHLVIYRLTE